MLASQGFLRTTLHTQAPSRRRLYRLVGSIPGCGRQTMCCATSGVHVSSSTQPQKVDEMTKRKRVCMCLPVWEKVEDVHSIFWFGWALAKKQFVDAGGMPKMLEMFLSVACVLSWCWLLCSLAESEHACESWILGSTLFSHPVLAGSRFATSRYPKVKCITGCQRKRSATLAVRRV